MQPTYSGFDTGHADPQQSQTLQAETKTAIRGDPPATIEAQIEQELDARIQAANTEQ